VARKEKEKGEKRILLPLESFLPFNDCVVKVVHIPVSNLYFFKAFSQRKYEDELRQRAGKNERVLSRTTGTRVFIESLSLEIANLTNRMFVTRETLPDKKKS